MEPEATVELWDKAVESARQQGSTRASANGSPLRLLALPMRRVLPNLGRRLDLIPDALRAALRELVGGKAQWPLLCWGPPGTGKTRSGLAVLDCCASGLYWEVPRLCDALIDAGKDRYEVKTQDGFRKRYPGHLWGGISDAAILVLDEIGARDRVSDFHYETVKRAIDERESKPAIYLSNLGPEALERIYDDRIASRLSAGTVIELAGDDRRIKR